MGLKPSSHTPKLNQIETGQSQPKNQSPVSGPIRDHRASGRHTLRFRSRSLKLLGRLQSNCTYMISKVPICAFSGFWTLTLKFTQHFDLFYNIGKSDCNILRNIIKTAEDSYTITIKQAVRFHERMHLKKIQLDQIQNGRLSAIIHIDRPDIAEYHENRSR